MTGSYQLFANSSAAVFGVDAHQKIVLWNPAAADLFGRKAGEVLGRNCCDVIGGRDADDAAVCRIGCEAFLCAEQLEPPAVRELKVRTASGATRWLLVSTIVIPAQTGELQAMVHICHDLSREHEVLMAGRTFASALSRATTNQQDVDDNGAGNRLARLTGRELEVLRCLSSGATNQGIAEQLGISLMTARNHVSSILRKLGVQSRLEAATYALRRPGSSAPSK